jgi:hypothetical protein
MNKVYINCLSSFLPNESVDNEHIEDFLGYIEGKKSRIKSIVLKRNGIKHRYYALNEEGAVTHRNSGMVVEAIKKLSSLGGCIRFCLHPFYFQRKTSFIRPIRQKQSSRTVAQHKPQEITY